MVIFIPNVQNVFNELKDLNNLNDPNDQGFYRIYAPTHQRSDAFRFHLMANVLNDLNALNQINQINQINPISQDGKCHFSTTFPMASRYGLVTRCLGPFGKVTIFINVPLDLFSSGLNNG